MAVCVGKVDRGTVAENRKCGMERATGWKLCAAHLSVARQRLTQAELFDIYAECPICARGLTHVGSSCPLTRTDR